MSRANGHQIGPPYYVWDLEGGPIGWKSPEYNAFHPVDPYLFELGWRAWLWLVEELNGSSALTAIESTGRLDAIQAVWRRTLRWSRITWLVGAIAAAFFFVAALLGGEISTPIVKDGIRPSRRLGTYRCDLAVKASSGWVRDIQVDFTSRLIERWRGPGAIALGVVWAGDRGLNWAPRARESGAWAFELRAGDIERIRASSVGVRSSGLVVTTSESGEAWLLLRRSDAATFLNSLEWARLGGPDDSS